MNRADNPSDPTSSVLAAPRGVTSLAYVHLDRTLYRLGCLQRCPLNRSLPYIEKILFSIAPAAFFKWSCKIENATGFLYI
jgi:hypothetical protein